MLIIKNVFLIFFIIKYSIVDYAVRVIPPASGNQVSWRGSRDGNQQEWTFMESGSKSSTPKEL